MRVCYSSILRTTITKTQDVMMVMALIKSFMLKSTAYRWDSTNLGSKSVLTLSSSERQYLMSINPSSSF